MLSSCGFNATIGGLMNNCAERLRIRGVAETPDIFYLFLREFKCFGNVKVRGESLEARWVDCFVQRWKLRSGGRG